MTGGVLGEQLRALILEHDAADVELAVHELERAGFAVVADVAATRAEFTARLAESPYDIILADYRLPGWTGMDALRLVQDQQHDIPLVLVSGTLGEERAVDCVKQGAADYVLKTNLSRLPVAVRRAVAERLARVDRARADETIRRLKHALDQSAAAVIITDTSGTIEYVNDRFTQITGYAATEAIGANPRLLKSGLTSPKTYADMWTTIRAGRTWYGEIQNRRKSGELFWNAVSISPVRDETGGVTHYIGTQEDVTERRRAEHIIREREALFRQLGDNIKEVFYLASASYDEMLYINPAYERIWGRSCQSVYDDPLSFAAPVPGEDRARLHAHIAQLQRGEDPGEVDFRVIRPDGTVRWVASDAVAVRNEHGAVYRITGVAVDITERKLAEEALAESEARYRKLTEASFDGVAIVVDGRIVDANRGVAAIFGHDLEEMIGRPVLEFFAEESVQLVRERLAGGVEGTSEVVGVHHDGRKLILEATARNHVINGKPGRVTALRDVTEKRQLEQQLRQAQKMEAVGRLAGGIAHDFNNLLTVISGNSELMLWTLGNEHEAVEELKEIRKAADAATTLTRQLLAFSRQQVIEPRLVVVEDVIANTVKIFKRLLGEDIELSMALWPMPSTVRIDPGQLEQILMNLAVNARDAMPVGGKLAIETKPVALDETSARTHWDVAAGRYVMISVSDTGTGMDEPTRSRIFEPFFTTKDAGKGTGLGLSTVYGIVKNTSGTIAVRSEHGQGATFEIYLPLAPATAAAEPAATAAPARHGTETVLVVEDAASVRNVVRQTLERHGYSVVEAASGTAALAFLANAQQQVHLLITDVVMPEMSGRRLVDEVNAVRPGMKVLYMSGYIDDSVARHGVLEPSVHYIQKPFSADALAHTVRTVLDSSYGARSGVAGTSDAGE